MKQTHYDVLGVAESATAEEVKTAYRAQAKEHHPDRNGGDASSGERLKRINAANEVLSDPAKRAVYDEQLRAARARDDAAKRPAAGSIHSAPAPVPAPVPVALRPAQTAQPPQASFSLGDLFFGVLGVAGVALGINAIAGGGSYYDANVGRRRNRRTGRFRPG